jgi:uncharacterized protein (TIGR00106 family)
LSVYPTDRGESVSQYVAQCVEVIERSGLAYKLGDMGTTIEAESVAEALAVAEQCIRTLQDDCHRVLAHIEIDWRKGREQRLESKIHSVEEKLGHRLHT